MPSSVVFLAATPATGARSTCTVTKENTLSSRLFYVPIVVDNLDEVTHFDAMSVSVME
ncbi:hypothetical protein PENSOL_c068G02473 [Penicillium solitum]|uniref:Uncharacterized protein n=1 Tax=Penicillium solitum TaxID=60172 RepID=A0A1V6QIR5_9EURO|nr:uncharacterized protein PENSOL_c068G02473 [Penicillium solitum]OQD89101.1 hypothetical protein PENSOL_c068G02473 [Penicillium solitum]